MSVRSTLKALPTLLRVGFSEAIAYRAEMVVWALSTTMPLVMLALWSAVAREAPIGRFGQSDFTAYFLCTFIVRQLTGAWAAWQMNFEVRTGVMSMRLLRPVHPVLAYAAENIAYSPMKLLLALPVAVLLLVMLGADHLTHDPVLWVLLAFSLAGAWLITFLANVAVGTLSLYMEQSLKVMDVWLAGFFVCSGYLVPVELFPGWMQGVLDWLPFRYQIGLPVELMTGAHGRAEAVRLVLQQFAWVGAFALGGHLLWQRGLKRFGAYGG